VPDVSGDPDDRLAAAVAELYGAAPEEFTGRRGELVAAAREAGDRAAAKAIGALRRPTRAAWVVNRLARTDPAAPGKLAELGAALGAAQQERQAARLRELSAARWTLIDALVSQALAAAGLADPPPSLREEVSQTLSAALADPAVAADFAAGTLTRATQWSGFGLAPADAGATIDWSAAPARGSRPDSGSGSEGSSGSDAGSSASAAGTETRANLRAVPAPRRATTDTATRPRPPAAPAPDTGAEPAAGPRTGRRGPAKGQPARPQPTPAELRAQEARRRADEAERQAAAAEQVAAEQAARRQAQYEEAQRTVAVAAAAAAEATAAEDRLESEVRDLEERLTRARADLAAVRKRARHAETAERRARQAMDRIPPPDA